MKKLAGFTLIELLIALGILVALTAIAYPLYTEQSQRARRAEAITALSIIAAEQERVYTVNGAYTTTWANLDVDVKWQLTDHQTENDYYQLALSQTTTQDFTATATATGSQAGDTDCASFTIDNLGIRSAKMSDETTVNPNCWQQ